MKLYNSSNSPYGRKVRVVALELEIADQIELIDTNPRDGSGGFWSLNPLAKIPVLELDDGRVIYDSPVICEYLVQRHGAGRLLDDAGRDPWDVRILAALADGAMDAAMLVRLEMMRPENERSATDMAKQMATAERAVDRLQDLLSDLHDNVDLGTIGAGCCVAWLMLRHPAVDWLGARPALARWYEHFSARESMRRTVPGLPLVWNPESSA